MHNVVPRAGAIAALLFVSSIATATPIDPYGGNGSTPASPPRPAVTKQAPGLRLRTQMSDNWVGPTIPTFVPKKLGVLELEILDRVDSGFMALYRETYDTCALGTWMNCGAEVRTFDLTGHETGAVPINPFFSRKDYLEVQDARVANGTLYFNEACITYSKDANGRCSSLVAVDIATKKVLWRTPSLVSNNYFQIAGDYIVAAYGFTAEPGAVRVVRRKDGAILDKQALPGTNFEMVLKSDVVSINLYYDQGRADFRMTGFEGASPKLVRVPLAKGATAFPPAP